MYSQKKKKETSHNKPPPGHREVSSVNNRVQYKAGTHRGNLESPVHLTWMTLGTVLASGNSHREDMPTRHRKDPQPPHQGIKPRTFVL